MSEKTRTDESRQQTAPDREGRVLIIGISGGLGSLLARRLHRTENVWGVDLRPMRGKPKDVTVKILDYRKKKIADLFRAGDIKAVFHLGAVFTPATAQREAHEFNLTGTARLLELCDKYNVPKVVILSTATVYGALPTNDQYLKEDVPLLGGLRLPEIRALVEMDMLAQTFFWKHSHIDTVILRPVHIVGPTVRNAVTYYLRQKRIPMLIGFDPLVQLVHEDDVVDALTLCLYKDVRGVFNIAGPTAVPLSVVIKELGKPVKYIPHPVASLWLDMLYKLKLSRFPAAFVDFGRYICLVDDTRAREILGYRPKRSMRETIRSVLYEI